MFWLKACPKCKGDLYMDMNSRGEDIVCLQCGYRRFVLTSNNNWAGKGYEHAMHTPHHIMSRTGKGKVI